MFRFFFTSLSNMKVVLFLAFVAVTTATPVAFEEEQLLRNSIDELVRKTFEYARWLLTKHEPYPFPDLPEQTLVDDDVNIKFSSSNLLLSKATGFTVDKVSNNLPTLQSSFQVSIPSGHLEGGFNAQGTAFNKNVEGSGKFAADIDSLVVRGDIQFEIVDHSLQIKELKIDYDIKGAHFDGQGLKIEGMSEEEVKDFLNKQLIQNLEEHKAFVCQKIANHATEIANKVLKGHSLQDVLNFLKELVASTPDPPPFPTFAP